LNLRSERKFVDIRDQARTKEATLSALVQYLLFNRCPNAMVLRFWTHVSHKRLFFIR
jgi:hypothetical protein